MNKKIKSIFIELLIMYISAIIVKIFINKFIFNFYYLIEVIPFVIGTGIGSITFEYFHSRKRDKQFIK